MLFDIRKSKSTNWWFLADKVILDFLVEEIEVQQRYLQHLLVNQMTFCKNWFQTIRLNNFTSEHIVPLKYLAQVPLLTICVPYSQGKLSIPILFCCSETCFHPNAFFSESIYFIFHCFNSFAHQILTSRTNAKILFT